MNKVAKAINFIQEEIKDPDKTFKPVSKEERIERFPAIAKDALEHFGGEVLDKKQEGIWIRLQHATKEEVETWLIAQGLDVEYIKQAYNNPSWTRVNFQPYIRARKSWGVFIAYYIKDKELRIVGQWPLEEAKDPDKIFKPVEQKDMWERYPEATKELITLLKKYGQVEVLLPKKISRLTDDVNTSGVTGKMFLKAVKALGSFISS